MFDKKTKWQTEYDFCPHVNCFHLTTNLFLKPSSLFWKWEISDVKSKIEMKFTWAILWASSSVLWDISTTIWSSVLLCIPLAYPLNISSKMLHEITYKNSASWKEQWQRFQKLVAYVFQPKCPLCKFSHVFLLYLWLFVNWNQSIVNHL